MPLYGPDTTVEEYQVALEKLRDRERTLLRDLETLEDDAFSLATDLRDHDLAGLDDDEAGKLSDLHVQAGELDDRIKLSSRELSA